MKMATLVRVLMIFGCTALFSSCASSSGNGSVSVTLPLPSTTTADAQVDHVPFDHNQTAGWSRDDVDFFLYGSMGAEFVPDRVLRAFQKVYPDLFPGPDLDSFGLLVDRVDKRPVGISLRETAHLGGLPSSGVNCSSCHMAEIHPKGGGAPVRVMGGTGQFDAGAFFNAVVAASYLTPAPVNMEKFLHAYLDAADPSAGPEAHKLLADSWKRQRTAIQQLITADPGGGKGAGAGNLHPLTAAELRLDYKRLATKDDLVAVVRSMLRLFHNMHVALHLPDAPPTSALPPPGPGRNDPWMILSLTLLGIPTDAYAPVKFTPIWDVDQRIWVHADGNNRDTIARNLIATLALGAPMHGKHGDVDFATLKRQTELGGKIHPPRYPWSVDRAAAGRGGPIYKANCASCHDVGSEYEDRRLIAVDQVGTDPVRAQIFTPRQAKLHNQLAQDLQVKGYVPSKTPPWRSTQKYRAPDLAGVWARAPYLHNGAVLTVWDLLAPPAARPKVIQRGTREYDTVRLGYVNAGSYKLDTTQRANSNAGHAYGTMLTDAQKRDLIEYLKTR